jgi:hypothetical protein
MDKRSKLRNPYSWKIDRTQTKEFPEMAFNWLQRELFFEETDIPFSVGWGNHL